MRAIPSALQTYLDAGKTWITRNLVFLTLSDASTIGFSDGEVNQTITVTTASGSSVARSYLGGGHLVEVPELAELPSLAIRTIEIVLSMASDEVLDLVQSKDLRGAVVEWHLAFYDEDTRALIAEPDPEFVGFVNGANPDEPAVDLQSADSGEDLLRLECVSHARELTRTSAKTRSYEAGLERSGDKIFKYAAAAHTWNIRWGSEKRSHKQQHGDKKGSGKNDPLSGFGNSR